MKDLKNKLSNYYEIEENFKHQIKVGANGDAFIFNISLQTTYEENAEFFSEFPSNENSKLTFEYESDECAFKV